MRLTPIEAPRNPLVRLFYRVLRRQFGRPLTPYQVIFARLPRAIPVQLAIYASLGGRLPLDPGVQLLVQHHVATLNGCTFCTDIGRAVATYRGAALDKVEALPDWRTSPLFTERERAALAYVEEATRHRHVSDDTFATLRRHFDDREIVAITWLNAVENYFNLLNLPLGIESDGLCAIAERRTRRRHAAAPDAGASTTPHTA